MHRADRTSDPAPQAESRKGSTRRAYVGGVYSVDLFVRDPLDVLDELLREQAAARPLSCYPRATPPVVGS